MAIIILTISFNGSVFADSSISDKAAKDTKKEYGQIKERYKHHSGPPAHAPAHGYRTKYQYHYYLCDRLTDVKMQIIYRSHDYR